MNEMDTALAIFAQEAEELLVDMEDALLSLDSDPDNGETVNSLFRAMHTIKGSSGLFGFDPIVVFTHEAETVLDKVRQGERQIDSNLIAVLLESKDHAAKLIEHCLKANGTAVPAELAATGLRLIAQLNGGKETAIQQRPDSVEDQVLSEGGGEIAVDEHWLISLEFKPDSFRDGIDPLSFYAT